jgi:hypothetical protein
MEKYLNSLSQKIKLRRRCILVYETKCFITYENISLPKINKHNFKTTIMI